MKPENKAEELKCPTCNAPVKMTWGGLDLVEQSGDETLATKHYEFIDPIGNVDDGDELKFLYNLCDHADMDDDETQELIDMIFKWRNKQLASYKSDLVKRIEERIDSLESEKQNFDTQAERAKIRAWRRMIIENEKVLSIITKEQ